MTEGDTGLEWKLDAYSEVGLGWDPWHPASPVVLKMSPWEGAPWDPVYDEIQHKSHTPGSWVSKAGSTLMEGIAYLLNDVSQPCDAVGMERLSVETPSCKATRTTHLELVLSDHPVRRSRDLAGANMQHEWHTQDET